MSEKILFVSILIAFFSLFFPWISHGGSSSTTLGQAENIENAFSSMIGYAGYMIMVLLGTMMYTLVINSRKRTVFFLGIRFSPSSLLITCTYIILALELQSIFIIGAMEMYFSSVYFEKGISLAITSTISLIIGVYLFQKDSMQNISGSYIQNISESYQRLQKKVGKKHDNMKFPF